MKSSTVLVIDDDESMRWLITMVLKDYTVIAKSNGLEAMSWLSKANIPDLIILDRAMPFYDGITFLRGLKGSGLYKDVPVLFVSCWTEKELEDDLKGLGAIEIIQKPFDPGYLLERVEHNLHEEALLN